MDWSQKVFIYCERGADPEFWAEPLNALSNGAFLIAAAAALAAWVREPRQRRGVIELALIVIVLVIGVGSFLFHTLAVRWAVLADTLPITAFMLIYLCFALRRFLSLSWPPTAMLLSAFVLALQAAGSVRCAGGPCLNGSLGYVPALVALGLVGAALWRREHEASAALLWGALVFAASLTFRTLDRALCAATTFSGRPLGMHALWHVLNAAVLYLLLTAALRHGRKRI
jgi:hypothetical protein